VGVVAAITAWNINPLGKGAGTGQVSTALVTGFARCGQNSSEVAPLRRPRSFAVTDRRGGLPARGIQTCVWHRHRGRGGVPRRGHEGVGPDHFHRFHRTPDRADPVSG